MLPRRIPSLRQKNRQRQQLVLMPLAFAAGTIPACSYMQPGDPTCEQLHGLAYAAALFRVCNEAGELPGQQPAHALRARMEGAEGARPGHLLATLLSPVAQGGAHGLRNQRPCQ
jgi:hypothetical protein